MMNDKQRHTALGIMDKLLARPASFMFRDPVTEEEVDYLSKVPNPIDLTTIKRQLEEKKYKYLTDWFEDIEKVWANTELVFGDFSFEAATAREMRKYFEKLLKPFSSDSISIWTRNVQKYRAKLSKFQLNTPLKIKTFVPTMSLIPPPRITPLQLTPHEIQEIIIAAESLRDEKDRTELIDIILNHQPQLFDQASLLQIDFGKLNEDTLVEIQNYFKRKNAKE